MKFDRDKFLTGGLLAVVFGVVAYVAATQELFADSPEVQDLVDSFSPLLILVSPILVVAGIVMLVVAFAANKDEPRSTADNAALVARTNQIMKSEGLSWQAAFRRAKNETAQPPPEPGQDSPGLEHRLRELKQLHDDGLIDTEEYQRKQRLLLDGL